MANLCEKLLDSCIAASCENPIFSGVDSKAYIFNKSEISELTPSSGSDPGFENIVEAIVMKEIEEGVNYMGYSIIQLGKQPYEGTNTAFAEGNISNTFTHTFNFLIPDNSPAAAHIIDNLANGKFVVVIKNDYSGSDTKGTFQIYGAKKGLSCTGVTNEKYGDAEGGWAITLTEENAPNSAMFFYKEGAVEDEKTLDRLVDCGEGQ